MKKRIFFSFKIFFIGCCACVFFGLAKAGAQSLTINNPSVANEVFLGGSGNSFIAQATAANTNGYTFQNSITFSIDGGTAVAGTLAGKVATYTINTGALTTGAHTLKVVAAFNFGGSQTKNITFYVVTGNNGSTCASGGTVSLSVAGAPTTGVTYKWYTVPTGGTSLASTATYSPTITAPITYYAGLTVGGIETRIPVYAGFYGLPFAQQTAANGAVYSYPFTSGSNTEAISGVNNAIPQTGATPGQDRYGATNDAYVLNGTTGFIATTTSITAPSVYTLNMWFETTVAGGALAGFNSSQTGSGGTYDRSIYLNSAGQVVFGIYNGGFDTVRTQTAYNDGQWHMVTVSVSTNNGISLYLDGVLASNNTTYTVPQTNTGWWRYGNQSGGGSWPDFPTNAFFKGSIDDIAVFNKELSVNEVYTLQGVTTSGAVCAGGSVTLSANTVNASSWSWTGPGGFTSNLQNPVINNVTAANAGTYTCTATSSCGTSSASGTVVVNALPAPVVTVSAASVAVNTNVTVTLTSTPATGDTFAWDFNGGTPATATTKGPFSVQWSVAGTKTITLVETNSSGCSTTVTQTVQVTAAQLTGYAFSKPLVLNTSQISVGPSNTGISTALANFPALVYIQDNALKIDTVCNNRVQYPNGNYNGIAAGTNYDFAFTLAGSTTELNYQVDTYDQQDGILLAWVQIPSMTNVNTNLSFYFGNAAPANHGVAFTQATWASDYLVVYHFNEGSTSATVGDATSNLRNATQSNTTAVQDEIHQVAGIPTNNTSPAGAYSFNGTSTQIVQTSTSTNYPILTTSGTFTESAWVYCANASGDNKIMTDQVNYGPGYKLSVTTGNVQTETRNNPSPYSPTGYNAGAVSNATWTYIQGQYDGSGHFINYVNGVATAQGTGKIAGNGGLFSLGLDYGSTTPHYYSGAMDEVRVSTAVKSADWIRAEYYNQSNPVSFTNYSASVATYQATAQTIPGALTYTWTGAAGDNLVGTAGNWNNTTSGVVGQAPNTASTVIIPNGGIPKLNGNAQLYGLTLNGNGKVNLNGFTLNVACHIYNQATGVIDWNNSDASVLNWNGSIPQNYYGNSGTAGYTRVGVMTVNNSTGSNITIYGDSLDVFHELTITKGNIVTDHNTGYLCIKSTRLETANVDAIPSAYSITGNVAVERYIPGGTGYRNYRLVTLPVNISGTINQNTSSGGTESYMDLSTLSNGMLTAGPGPAGSSGFSYGTATANPLTYLYDESRAVSYVGYITGKNVGIYSMQGSPAYTVTTYGTTLTGTKTTKQVPVGNSVQAYYVGPSTATNLTATAPVATTTLSVGTLNQGTIPVYLYNYASAPKLSYTTATNAAITLGVSQVGNPYASTISLDQVYTDNKSVGTGISPSFYLLKQPGNTIYTYNSVTTGTSSTNQGPYVASGQGFYVKALGTNSTLTFKETEKVNQQLIGGGTPALTLSQRQNNTMSAAQLLPSGLAGLHVQITRDSINNMQTGVYFSKSWNDKYNDQEDALDMNPTTTPVYIASYSADNSRLSINSLGDYSNGKVVKLHVAATASGSYKINLADIKNIDTLYNVYLRDHQLKDSVNLRTNNTYSFTINTGDTSSYGANRFDLLIAREALPPYQLLTFTGQKVTTGVQLQWAASGAGTYTGFTLQKQGADNTFSPIYTVQSNNTSNYGFTDTHPVIGDNIYRLAQNDVNGNISYSSLISIGYNNVSSNGYFSVYPNPSKDIINVLVNSSTSGAVNYTADIYSTSGVSMDHRVLNSNTWTEDISSYKEGVYIMVLKNTNGDVLGKAKFIKVK